MPCRRRSWFRAETAPTSALVFEPVITVVDGRVSSRSIRFKEQLGSWKGLRFTYGKNMAGCMRTVLEQDVYTALYGFGAGLPVTDEDGRYTRRPASKPS